MSLHPDFLRRAVAHRGLHSPGVPENSMAAFRAAIDAGYGIELDIQHAADGTPMVFHDYDLTRLCGDEGYIADLDPEDLAELRLLGTDEPIPTLAAVLREVAGQVPLLIEIKDQDGRLGPNVGDLSQRVATALAAYEGPVAVMSFNPHAIAAFAKAAPDITRGLTSCAFPKEHWPMLDDETRTRLADLPDFDRVGASFISHSREDLGHPAVLALRTRGVPVLSWTIRSKAEEDAARAGSDNITFENYLA